MPQRSYRTESSFRKALKKATESGTLVHWYGTDHGWVIVTRKMVKNQRAPVRLRHRRRTNPYGGTRYRGVISAIPGHLLRGGKKQVKSTWFNSKKEAHDWIYAMEQPEIGTHHIERGAPKGKARKVETHNRIPNGRLVSARIKHDGHTYPGKVKRINGRVKIFVTPAVARKINPESLQLLIERAFEVGEKTGVARKQRDEARAKFHKDWFVRFKALQRPEDKNQIQQAFDNGYKAGYGDVPVRYFR